VEQSGGLAPGANIIVYQAPNTNQGFIDLFAAAIEANKADSLSVSWGLDEPLTELNPPVTDPLKGSTVDFMTAAHELFLRAAIQGQTVFAASGDGGAYDVNEDLDCFGPYNPSVKDSCSLTLTVDYPASDPFITGAGGSTLAGHQRYCLNKACTPPLYQVEIPKESVWGWDYLTGLCKTLGFDPISCGIYPAGGGGGVSVFFPVPSYQSGLPGIQLSQPGQNLYLQPFGLLDQLPAFYAGRNVPDISLNADPDSGYVLFYTSDKTGFGAQLFFGGTSFVAPQLAGITALFDQNVFGQDVNKRIGLLNPTLYGLAASGQAYGGSKAPLNQITSGDNWVYSGSKGYNPGAGLGTIDAANLAAILRSQF
jgi:subtilase family serine protease